MPPSFVQTTRLDRGPSSRVRCVDIRKCGLSRRDVSHVYLLIIDCVLLPRSTVEPEVVKRESAAALPVVIVTLAYYARPVPLPESAPGESAAFAGWRVQVKRPCRMRLVCSVARNRALSK